MDTTDKILEAIDEANTEIFVDLAGYRGDAEAHLARVLPELVALATWPHADFPAIDARIRAELHGILADFNNQLSGILWDARSAASGVRRDEARRRVTAALEAMCSAFTLFQADMYELFYRFIAQLERSATRRLAPEQAAECDRLLGGLHDLSSDYADRIQARSSGLVYKLGGASADGGERPGREGPPRLASLVAGGDSFGRPPASGASGASPSTVVVTPATTPAVSVSSFLASSLESESKSESELSPLDSSSYAAVLRKHIR